MFSLLRARLAFYTVITVLFDTFVVRIFLVPALFSVKAEWNWWPGSAIRAPQVMSVEGAEESADLLSDDGL